MSSIDPRPAKVIIKQLAKQKKTSNNILFSVVNTNQVHITFNRPKVMNAFSFDMYFSFIEYIQKANEMAEIKYIVLRGAGGNFSSGNDLKNFVNPQLAELDKRVAAQTMADILSQLTEVIVKSKKPIFAIAEGRVIGFAFTQLALYDKVFAVEDSYFMAPLVKIAQGPQMASSYLFPKIFGQNLAQQILIKAKSMKPKDLQKYSFVTSCKTADDALNLLNDHIKQLQQLDWASYVQARKLMRQADKQNILKANNLQCENLVQRWVNPDLPQFLVRYLASQKQRPKL